MNTLYLSSLIAFFLCIILSILVYFKDPKKELNISFSIFVLGLSFWIFGDFFYFTKLIKLEAPVFWLKLAHIGAVFTPPALMHFIISLTKIKTKKVFIVGLYFISLGLVFTNIFSVSFILNATYNVKLNRLIIEVGYFYYIFLIYVISILVTSYLLLFKTYKTSIGISRQQISYFFFGTV